MNSALRLLCCGILGMALVSIAGCESSGSSSSSIGVSYGYGYGGYYGSYYGNPGYWYDDDRPIVVNPPENRPGRPTTLPAQQPSTRPAQQPSTQPSMPSTRPSASRDRREACPVPRRVRCRDVAASRSQRRSSPAEASCSIAFGGFQHETNTFSPVKATFADFEAPDAWPGLTRGEALFDAVAGSIRPPRDSYRRRVACTIGYYRCSGASAAVGARHSRRLRARERDDDR